MYDGKPVAARMVVPYPPGVPVLVPGQLVTHEVVDYVRALARKGVEIHGYDRETNTIRVLRASQ